MQPIITNSSIYEVYLKTKDRLFFKILFYYFVLFLLFSAALLIFPFNLDPMVNKMAQINLFCIPGFLFIYLMDIITYKKIFILPLPLTLKDWFFLGELFFILFFLYSSFSIVFGLFGINLTPLIL